ncbi:MAG: translocation/assembly module TamB [Tannerella sp.]|nr:translocation/assembly module TamB [Tannerella sp.]
MPVISLNIPFIQRSIANIAEDELSKLFGTSIKIANVDISWLNRLVLKDVRIDDQKGESILKAGNITAGFKILPAFKNKWILTTVRLFGVSCHIKKETPGSETNIQFIIDALSKNPQDNDRNVELQIHSIVIRRSSITYDVLNKKNTRQEFNPNHIHINNISGKLSLKQYDKDHINVQISKLRFDEISGLNVDKLSMNIVSGKDTAYIENLTINFPHSFISIPSAGISMSDIDSLPKLLDDKSLLTVNIAPSEISLNDFASFLPVMKDFSESINVSANISGSINDVSLNELFLQYGTEMSFAGNMGLKGLAGKNDELYLFGQVKKLNITTEGLRKISNNLSNPITLPEPIMKLNELTFNGEISGFTNHLVAFGNLSSPIGSVHMDMLIGNKKDMTMYLKGNIASSELKIRDLFEKDNSYGNARFNAEVDFIKPVGQKASGSVKAQINEFDYSGYSYENIYVSGKFKENGYEGLVHVNDPNGMLEIRGVFLNENEKSVFDFMANIRNLHLDKLHITDKYENPEMSLAIKANFTGNNPDDFEGSIELENLSFHTSIDSFALNGLRIETSRDERPHKRIRISSDIIDGEITGVYSFSSLANDLLNTSGTYLPSLIKTIKKKDVTNKSENRFDFFFTIKNTESISDILKLPVAILRKSSIRGQYNNATNSLTTDLNIPLFNIGKTRFENGNLHIDNADESLNIELTASQNYKGNTYNHIRLKSYILEDSINATFYWTNNKENKFEAEIAASALFVEENNNKKLRTEITIPPAQITLNDSLWNIEPASVTIAGGNIYIDNFYITKDNQYLHIDGVISDNPQELLFVDLKDIEISHIFDVLNIPSLQFGGRTTGTVNAHDLLGSMMIEGRIEIRDFSFNQAVQGKLNLSSEWDNDRQGILLLGSIYPNDSVWTDVNGYIFPIGENQGLSLYFDANLINIAFVQKYMKSFAREISGFAFGNVHLYGSFSDIFLEGTPYIKDGNMKINILNTSYGFSDTLFIDQYAIKTKNMIVLDKDGNTGSVNLNFTHDNFRDMKYDLDIKTDNLLVYDIPERDNPEIYGQVYASGTVNINGTEDNIYVEGNMRSNTGTSVGFNFTENSMVENYDFISFIEKPEDENHKSTNENDKKNAASDSDNSSMDYRLNFLVNVTPDAKLELTMDPASGDKIRGSGNGDIQIQYGSQSDIQIFGNYLISEGIYNFSLQQVIRKRFNIRDGSIVTFRGDPMASSLDINAIYNLTANIQDLDETFIMETMETANPSIPVNCVLKLEGRLQNPAITFDLELPNSNSELERQVKSFIDTEDMMTRQIIYLLVLNKFYTPDYSRNDYRSNEFSAVASSALSAQLSSILGSLTDKVQIGTNIRSRQDGVKDTEVEMLLSSRLLNNRLLFNGNFGYKDNTIMSNAFVGEFDLEYKLTRSGEVSLKAYNHANDLYRYNTKSLTRQGVGVMFRKDFSALPDIFIRKKREENSSESDVPKKPNNKDLQIPGTSLYKEEKSAKISNRASIIPK